MTLLHEQCMPSYNYITPHLLAPKVQLRFSIMHDISTSLESATMSLTSYLSYWAIKGIVSAAAFCATWSPIVSFLWISFLIYDIRKTPNAPTFAASLRLFLHLWPATLFYFAAKIAQNHEDPLLVWFILIVVMRYYRTVVNLYYWFQYEPALPNVNSKLRSEDCTVISATVGPKDNEVFDQMVSSILFNKPSRLVFSTNTSTATIQVEEALPAIVSALELGKSTYQRENRLHATEVSTEILVLCADISNKRRQVVHALKAAKTAITVMADDTAIWSPHFLKASLPAFADEKVGFVGTKKWVKREPRTYDPRKSWLANLWSNYWTGFWNTIGALYLIRHNFEIRATNAADGGVFCVSGRTSLIRTCIIDNDRFQRNFLNEFVLRLGERFCGWGPVVADDDNFLTRYIITEGWDVKIQYSDDSTITTSLGKYPKFLGQCLRWSRTTFRQNPIALFVDRTIWWKWPITVWTTYFPWMLNFALFWDPLMLLLFSHTQLYAASEHPKLLLAGFVGFIWTTKLVKTVPWFWKHPIDFWLYFFPIPAYPLFAYGHSVLKLWTLLTFWDVSWAGRKLP